MDDFLNTTTCEEYYREPDSFASLLPCDYAIWENTDCTKCPYKSDCWDQTRVGSLIGKASHLRRSICE